MTLLFTSAGTGDRPDHGRSFGQRMSLIDVQSRIAKYDTPLHVRTDPISDIERRTSPDTQGSIAAADPLDLATL